MKTFPQEGHLVWCLAYANLQQTTTAVANQNGEQGGYANDDTAGSSLKRLVLSMVLHKRLQEPRPNQIN